MISSHSRGSRLHAPVMAAILGVLAVSAIAGCTSAKSTPDPRASSAAPAATPPPAAVPYAGSCPAAETLSTAVGKSMSLGKRKPKGVEVDCSYSGRGATVAIGFESNSGTTPSQLLARLSDSVGRDGLKRVPGLGQAAYEYSARDKGITVIAINHGFTVTVLATGLTASAAIKAEAVAVGVGGH